MFGYEFLCKTTRNDLTVVTVNAESINSAQALVQRMPLIHEVVKLCTIIDRQPQKFLAW